MSREKFKPWNSLGAACRMTCIKLYLRMSVCQISPLFFATFSIFLAFFYVSRLLLSLTPHPYPFVFDRNAVCASVSLLPSLRFFLSPFSYLNVLPLLYFLLNALLSGHNMRLKCIFKHIFETFCTFCS